jgi:outer membrane lipoprotein-sorting protein
MFMGMGAWGAAEDRALNVWLERQGGLDRWAAAFTQTRRLPALAEPLMARGRVWFAAPKRFRWELGQPPETIAIRGTNQLAILYPRFKRGELYSLDAAAAGAFGDALDLLEAGFPRNRKDLEAQFSIEELRPIESDLWRMVLRPRSARARGLIESVVIEFDPEQQGPRATELRFAEGTTLRNDFSAAVVNPSLEEGWFEAKVPEGYEISRPK